jgi:glycosyltransferase involved in cell wall biosynthesis
MTLLEAMCFGIPVIAPPVGGPTEFITSGENGFLIDARNTIELDHTIQELKVDPQLCNLLSKNARRIAKRFSNERLTSQINSILLV